MKVNAGTIRGWGMMRFLSILAVVAGLLMAQPVCAQDANPDANTGYYGVACSDHDADWQAASAGATTDRKLPSGQVATPKGTFTQIFTCTVAGHKVRMNFALRPVSGFHCGYTDDIRISAWVDGVKVIDNRQAGDYDACMTPDAPANNLEIWRVLVDDKMRLTMCDRLIDSEQTAPHAAADIKPGQSEEKAENENGETYYYLSQCRLTDLSGQTAVIDPWFDGTSVKRTPPTLDLAINTAAFCPSLTPVFLSNKTPQVDDALPPYRKTRLTLDGLDYDTAPMDDKAGEVATFAVDIDNDGVADTVTYSEQLAGEDPDGDYPGQYSWHSGKTGKDIVVTATLLNAPVHWSATPDQDPIRDDTTFIDIEGRFYLYKADNGFVDGFTSVGADGVEAEDGATDGDTAPSRHIYELHNDGTAMELCAWKAHKRPEEFL